MPICFVLMSDSPNSIRIKILYIIPSIAEREFVSLYAHATKFAPSDHITALVGEFARVNIEINRITMNRLATLLLVEVCFPVVI